MTVNDRIDQLSLEIRSLQLSREHKGISTASEWVTSLRTEGSLATSSVSLNSFLEGCAVNWWPTADVAAFPTYGTLESAICQPFVTARINEIVACAGQVHPKKQFLIPGTSPYAEATEHVDFRSIPVDGHSVVSYSGRKPDIVCYNGVRRGACAITLLGDVKGCGAMNRDFPEAEVGHILDMATDLLSKEQFARPFLFCFLTDGCKFQYFRCTRSQHGDRIRYEQSALFSGEYGWQVRYENCFLSDFFFNLDLSFYQQIFFGLLIIPVEDLGFVTFDVPNFQLLEGLGKGRFSTVFSCHPTQSNDIFVMKVFMGDTRHMAEKERDVLNSLSGGGVTNTPMFRELFVQANFSALILTPLGVSVLPCPLSAQVTPNMLVTLLQVVQKAHDLNWIHRDIKPDNIYLDNQNTSRIILNDWSSAVPAGFECDYVGTRLFADGPNALNKHTPDNRLDLRSLVKTVFCLLKQRIPSVEDNEVAVREYWDKVTLQFPLFRKAMDLADAGTADTYEKLAELFVNTL